MNICEAIKEMQRQGKKYISQTDFIKYWKIESTIGPNCCIFHCAEIEENGKISDKVSKGKRWQPQLDDFLSTNWIVCD